MKLPKENQNTYFNFRIRKSELDKLKQTTIQLGHISFAEFIRQAIREKIARSTNAK